MQFETERLLLRPWTNLDANDLYTYAKDERVGPISGWPVHTSVENSLDIIKNILSREGNYAIVLKETQKPIGAIGLMQKGYSNFDIKENEAEVGYWIGVPYWGLGLAPEAVHKIQAYAFETLSIETLWCAYYKGNEKSKRVQEKCGFTFHHIIEKVDVKSLGKKMDSYVTRQTKAEWISMNKNLAH